MVIPDGYAQINYLFTGDACPSGAQVTLGVDLEGFAGTPSDLGTQAIGWVSDSLVMQGVSSRVTLSGVLVKYGPNETGPSAVTAADIDGGYSSSDELANAALLIHKVTPLGGRAGRGRMYWPGAPLTEATSGGVLQGTYISGTQDNWDSFLAEINEDVAAAVVLHGEGGPISLPTPITEFVLDAQVATQRRRLRR